MDNMTEKQTTELTAIAERLALLTDAIQQQNKLIKRCIIQPDGQPARFVIGIAGAVETINF